MCLIEIVPLFCFQNKSGFVMSLSDLLIIIIWVIVAIFRNTWHLCQLLWWTYKWIGHNIWYFLAAYFQIYVLFIKFCPNWLNHLNRNFFSHWPTHWNLQFNFLWKGRFIRVVLCMHWFVELWVFVDVLDLLTRWQT